MLLVRFAFLLVVVSISAFQAANAAEDNESPRSTDPRLKIELFAESPQIVTPTGIDVDQFGRVWAIESNTHFPPEGYQGHPSDRILVMEDTAKTGRADKTTVFKNGLRHSMSIAVKPVWLDIVPHDANERSEKSTTKKSSIEVFIATRREISLCTDTDGDLICDETTRLVHLETSGDYPHNGLAGFAFDAIGNLYFGFGENLGADYKIIGSDGKTLSGGGEGGNIYRCRPDGSKLERWATGFWNPHANCFDAFGRMFSVDNDPDSRPPCRLLHIIEGGDYGYRFRNGRKGTHPFTSWNGEIPGTLPMVSGTGEAPSGIVAYESEGFPEDYRGTLLVGSWGDHRIDQFVLKPKGVSFESIPHPVIKGGENFRPVGLAVAPDGSLYVTDWVSKEYKLHGKGRVWRVSSLAPSAKAAPAAAVESSADAAENARVLRSSARLITRRVVARKMSQSFVGRSLLIGLLNDLKATERARIEALWALANVPVPVEKLSLFGTNEQPAPFLSQVDAVSVAAAELLGSPQLTPSQPASENLFVKGFEKSQNPWNAFVFAHVTEYFLKTQKFAGIGYMVGDGDPFLQTLIGRKLQQFASEDGLIGGLQSMSKASSPAYFMTAFLALRSKNPKNSSVPRIGLDSPNIQIRRAAVQWVAEENLQGLRSGVEKVLASEPMTADLFQACLASLSMLNGVKPAEFEKSPPVHYLLTIVKDTGRSATLRATALRMLPPAQKELDGKLLGELASSSDVGLRREAVRTLQHSLIPEHNGILRGIAADESLDANLRADAIAGLIAVDHRTLPIDTTRDFLIESAAHTKNVELRLEALRSLRPLTSAGPSQSPRDTEVANALVKIIPTLDAESKENRNLLAEALEFAIRPQTPLGVPQLLAEFSGPTESTSATSKPVIPDVVEYGRRTFFHVNGAGCYKCHMVGGRGGQVGPDLTVIARTMDRKKLAESILEPSKEISPQFTTWAIETNEGKVLTGMLLGEEVNGDLKLGNNLGEVFFVPFKNIATRNPLKTSIMPEKLHELMTTSEFRSLIAFLETLK